MNNLYWVASPEEAASPASRPASVQRLLGEREKLGGDEPPGGHESVPPSRLSGRRQAVRLVLMGSVPAFSWLPHRAHTDPGRLARLWRGRLTAESRIHTGAQRRLQGSYESFASETLAELAPEGPVRLQIHQEPITTE